MEEYFDDIVINYLRDNFSKQLYNIFLQYLYILYKDGSINKQDELIQILDQEQVVHKDELKDIVYDYFKNDIENIIYKISRIKLLDNYDLQFNVELLEAILNSYKTEEFDILEEILNNEMMSDEEKIISILTSNGFSDPFILEYKIEIDDDFFLKFLKEHLKDNIKITIDDDGDFKMEKNKEKIIKIINEMFPGNKFLQKIIKNGIELFSSPENFYQYLNFSKRNVEELASDIFIAIALSSNSIFKMDEFLEDYVLVSIPNSDIYFKIENLIMNWSNELKEKLNG